MAKIRVRLSDKDRAERDRGGEWFEVDAQLAGLDDLTWDELDMVERQTNSSALMLAQVERRALTARYWRVLLWLARRAGGITEDFAAFKPSVTQHGRGDPDVVEAVDETEPAPAGDADPPGGTPPASADSGESAMRSTSSTPPSPANTGSRRAKSAG